MGEEGRCIPGKGNRMYKGRRPRVRKSKMISHTGLEWGQLRLGHHNSLALEEALTQLLWVVCVLGMAKEGRKMGGENRKGQQHLSLQVGRDSKKHLNTVSNMKGKLALLRQYALRLRTPPLPLH